MASSLTQNQWRLSLTRFSEGPMHHRASQQSQGGTLTVLQFFLLILGVGIFTWAHPNLVTVLFLVVIVEAALEMVIMNNRRRTTWRRTARRPRRRRPPSAIFRPRHFLLTMNEAAFFRVLAAAIGDRYLISCKVRLADIITCGDRDWQRGHANRIAQKHVDFIRHSRHVVTNRRRHRA